jgi:glycerophosphoryl diester phosphodiesterase
MMRRFILTIEILFVSFFLIGGSFAMTGTATAGTTKFSWSDHRTIAHALGGLDGRDYLNSREGFLAMYQQGVRLFELDLSRTSDGVWVCRHNWKESMGQWKGSGKKVLTEKQFKNSKIYGTYTPMTLEDFFLLLKEHPDAYVMIDSKQYSLRNYQRTLEDYCDYVEIARAAGAESVLDQIIPEIYSEAMFPGTTMIYSFPSYVYSLWQEYSAEDLEHIASFCEEKGIPAATVYWKYWSEETEEIFEKKGIRLYVYTVNDRNQARKYIAQGAEGICTDFLTAEDLW